MISDKEKVAIIKDISNFLNQRLGVEVEDGVEIDADSSLFIVVGGKGGVQSLLAGDLTTAIKALAEAAYQDTTTLTILRVALDICERARKKEVNSKEVHDDLDEYIKHILNK